MNEETQRHERKCSVFIVFMKQFDADIFPYLARYVGLGDV